MKDVAALCRRVVVIAHGQIMYDGSLAGIIDRFSSHKIVTLLFAGDTIPTGPGALWRGARGESAQGQAARRPQRGGRSRWPRSWPRQTVQDVSVEDPPLEEVIAEMFSQASASRRCKKP